MWKSSHRVHENAFLYFGEFFVFVCLFVLEFSIELKLEQFGKWESNSSISTHIIIQAYELKRVDRVIIIRVPSECYLCSEWFGLRLH